MMSFLLTTHLPHQQEREAKRQDSNTHTRTANLTPFPNPKSNFSPPLDLGFFSVPSAFILSWRVVAFLATPFLGALLVASHLAFATLLHRRSRRFTGKPGEDSYEDVLIDLVDPYCAGFRTEAQLSCRSRMKHQSKLVIRPVPSTHLLLSGNMPAIPSLSCPLSIPMMFCLDNTSVGRSEVISSSIERLPL